MISHFTSKLDTYPYNRGHKNMVLFYQIRSFYVIDDAVPSMESNRGDSKSESYIKIRSYLVINDSVKREIWSYKHC